MDLSFGAPDAVCLGCGSGSLSGSYGSTTTTTDTNSQTITKGETLDIKATGNSDGVNHDEDAFLLLLNPAIAIKENQTFDSDQKCVPTGNVNWYVGLNTGMGSGQLLYYLVYVKELKNPASMRPLVAQQLQALKFTNDDYRTILSLDPFANGATSIDPDRYVPTTYAFPYQPLLQDTDCNNGVCTCVAFSDALKNEFQTEVAHTEKKEWKVDITATAGVNLEIMKLGTTADKSWTWSNSSTDSSTTDNSQTATATVACASSNYQGPATEMSIYWDKLYGSFLFVPIVVGSPQIMTLAHGNVTSASGQFLRHEKITLSLGGKTYHTVTDAHGNYVFFAAAQNVKLQPGSKGELEVKGLRKTVTLGSAEKIQLRLSQ